MPYWDHKGRREILRLPLWFCCPRQGSWRFGRLCDRRPYFTRSFLPRRRVVVSLMPLRRQMALTEV